MAFFKTIFMLASFLLAGVATSQVCEPGKGCNDPNSISARVTLPGVGVKAPPPVSTTSVTQNIGVGVDVKIIPEITSVTVDSSRLRGICISWENGEPCPAAKAIDSPVNGVKASEQKTKQFKPSKPVSRSKVAMVTIPAAEYEKLTAACGKSSKAQKP